MAISSTKPASTAPADYQIKMSDGRIITAPADMDKSKVKEAVQKYEDHLKTKAVDDSSATKELVKGAGRGLLQTGALIWEGVPAFVRSAAEQVTGKDMGAEESVKELTDALAKIENDPNLKASVGSYKDVNDFDSAVQYFTSALGQVAPDVLSGGIGGLVGKAAAKAGTKALVKEVTKEGLKKAGQRGFTAGLVGSGIAQEVPSTLASTYAETGKVDAGAALTAGVIKGGIEAISDKILLGHGDAVTGGLLKRMGKNAAKDAATEGATEVVQQGIDEAAAEYTDPEKATFDSSSLIEAGLQGAAGGGGFGAGMSLLPAKTEGTNVPQSRGIKHGIDESPVEETDAPKQEPVKAEAPVTAQPEAPISRKPVPATKEETDSVNELLNRTSTQTPATAEKTVGDQQILDTVAETNPDAAVVLDQAAQAEKPKSKFNMFTNVKDSNISGYAKEALDLVGFDEDIMLVDMEDLNDDSWVPLSAAGKWMGQAEDGTDGVKAKLANRRGAYAVAGSTQTDDGKPIHILGFNPSKLKNPSDLVRSLAHEAGHLITNRFVERDPEIKSNLVNAWKADLDSKGLASDGISEDDINNLISSWSFNEIGENVPTNAGDEKQSFEPIMRGSQAKGHIGQYLTAFDEYMAENIAKWYQSQQAPQNVLEKFFKSIADMYRKFIETAKSKGMMPNKTVDDFMNDLVMKARGAKVAQEYKEAPVVGLQELRAYHGSPHRFSKFSTAAMGSGEGYQAFGWGLYFTNAKSIAEFYRKKLSRDSHKLRRNGEIYDAKDISQLFKDNNITDVTIAQIDQALAWFMGEKGDYNKTFKYFEEFLNHPTTSWGGPKDPADLERVRKTYEAARALRAFGFTYNPTPGALYVVEIPEENEYMDWDKPFENPPKELVDAIELYFKKVPNIGREQVLESLKEWRGEDVYDTLINMEGSDKDASLFLNSIGIKGIRYEAGQLSGFQTPSGDTNYVIFDDAAVQINEVYDDDTLFAELRAVEENQAQDPKPEDDVTKYKGNPFAGYDINPKTLKSAQITPNARTKSLLGQFIGNFGTNTPLGDTNSMQGYAAIGQAITDDSDTYLQEAYRAMFKSKAVSDAQRRMLRTKIAKNAVVDAVAGQYGLTARDVRQFGLTETESEAYRVYRDSKKKPNSPEYEKFLKTLPDTVKSVFDFMDNMLNGLKQDLNNQGIVNMSDVLQGKANDVVPNFTNMMKDIRQNRAASRRRLLENQGLLRQFVKEDDTKMSKVGQWLWTPRFVARYSPLFADVKRAADERRQLITQYMHQFSKGMKNLYALDDTELDYLANIMDEQRRLGTKATVRPDGKLSFKREVDGVVKEFTLNNPELAKIYQESQNTLAMIPNLRQFMLRSSMAPLFAKAGLGFNPTRQDYDSYLQAKKEGTLKKSSTLTDGQMDFLDKYFDMVDHFDAMRTRDYVPHIRFGTRGVSVKDAKTGEQVWFKTYETDDNGKPNKESYEEFQKELAQYENNSKYRVSKDFQLTYDNIFNQLGKNEAITMEMLSQLMNSGSEKLFSDTMKGAFGSPEDYIEGRINKKGFTKHDLKAENVGGYSKDWRRSLSAYSNSAAYFLGNLEYEPKIFTMNTRLQNNSRSNRLKDYSKSFVDSIMSPTDNYEMLRAFQYFYAMGGNLSSAVIQATSTLTFMPAVLTIATNNQFVSGFNMAKASKVVPMFVAPDSDVRSESAFEFGNKDRHDRLIREGKLTRDESALILELYDTGILQALFTSEFVGAPSDYTTKGLKGKTRQKVKEWTNAAGFMMRTFEEGARGMQTMASIITLADPDNTMRLHNNLMENDAYYRNRVEASASKLPDKSYMVQWLIEKSLGEYGREGRAAYQNTALAVTALPFSTYPWQMLLNSYELLSGKYGAEGRKAGIWAMAFVGVTAGVWGVPGAMLMKETIELIIQQLTGEDEDLDELLREYILKYAPKEMGIHDFVSGGFFDAYTPVAIGSRLKYDVPLLTDVVKSVNGEQPMGTTDLLGVYGTVMQSPMKTYQAIAEGADPLSAITQNFIPNVAAQNLYKGLVQYPKEGKPYRGQFSLMKGKAPEGAEDPASYAGEWYNMLIRSIGFKPSAQNENEMEIAAAKRNDTKYDRALNPMRKKIEKAFKAVHEADDADERLVAQQKLKEAKKSLVDFMRKRKIPNAAKAIERAIKEARLNALLSVKGHEAGIARKKYRVQTRHYLDDIDRLYGVK